MYPKGLSDLLIQVITSWQVIAVTIALIFYIYIVSYAARKYRTPHAKKVKVKRKRATSVRAKSLEETSSNDDLGIEED